MENFATKLIENLRKERVVLEKDLIGTTAKTNYLRIFDSVIFAVNSALETTTQVVPQAKITRAEFKNQRGRDLFNCLMETFKETFKPLHRKRIGPPVSFEEFASSFTTLEDALTELFRVAKLYDCMALVGDVPTMSMIDICNQIVDCETSSSRMHILENIMKWLDLEMDFEYTSYVFNETIIDLADFAETSPKNVVVLIKKEVPALGDIPYSTTLNELMEQIVAVEKEPDLIPNVVEELVSYIFNADETVEIDIDKDLVTNASLNEMSVSELCDLITEYAACEDVAYVPDPHKS